MQKWRLNPDNWLVVKNTDEQLEIVHRLSNQIKYIPKREEGVV